MVRFLINKTINMEFEEIIKQKLINRGFTNKRLLNNRGLIGAVIDETILLQAKNLTIPKVNRSLPIEMEISFEDWLEINCIVKYDTAIYNGIEYCRVEDLREIYKKQVKVKR
jgi:hypothetical protein